MATAQLSKLRRELRRADISARIEMSLLVSPKRYSRRISCTARAEFVIFGNESVQRANQPDYGKVGQYVRVLVQAKCPPEPRQIRRQFGATAEAYLPAVDHVVDDGVE